MTCAWVDAHATARAAGGPAGVRRAVGALRGSRRWPVLPARRAQGDWPSVLWDVADRMAAGERPERLHGPVRS